MAGEGGVGEAGELEDVSSCALSFSLSSGTRRGQAFVVRSACFLALSSAVPKARHHWVRFAPCKRALRELGARSP
jgi:hypothetical protein